MVACTPQPRPETDPETVVRTFLQKLEQGDIDAVMALLHEDFVFRDAESTFRAGREDMPSMLAWDLEAEGRIEIQALEAEGEVVRVRLRETNRFTELLELAPWEVEATFTVREGEIQEEVARERVSGGPSFTERFQQELQPVVAWAAEVYPEAADTIFEDGRVRRYDGPTARRLLQLLEAYPGPGSQKEPRSDPDEI